MFGFLKKEKIKEITKDFFNWAGFSVVVNIEQKEGDLFLINIKTEEPKILIGQNGNTLFEIQRLLKAIIKKKIKEEPYIDLDINDYKKKKRDYLKENARRMADEVFLSKKEKILEPMSSYERKIIHTELSNRSDVETESIGENFQRRVVIKPKKSF